MVAGGLQAGVAEGDREEVEVGGSRKSFLGRIAMEALGLDAPPDPMERDRATLALSVVHALRGVRLFRVHDVRGHAEGMGVVWAMGGGG